MVGYAFSDLVGFGFWFGLQWFGLVVFVICDGLLGFAVNSVGMDSHSGVSFGLVINLGICV